MSGSDLARLKIVIDEERVGLDSDILSSPIGFISRMVRAEGPVWLQLEGDGALDDWQGRLEASIGDFGEIDAVVGGDLASLNDATVLARVVPGAAMPPIVHQLAGDTFDLRIRSERSDSLIAITIDEVSGRLGTVTGTVALETGDPLRIRTDIDADVEAEVAEEFGMRELAGVTSLTATAAQSGEAWRFEGEAGTPLGAVTVRDGQSSPDVPFSGILNIALNDLPGVPEAMASLVDDGVTANGDIVVGADGVIEFDDVSLQVGGSSTPHLIASADGQYTSESGALEATLTVSAAPTMIAPYVADLAFDTNIDAEVALSGRTDNLALSVNGEIPAGRFGDQSFNSGALTADVTGLPTKPTGTVRFTSDDQTMSGIVDVSTTETMVTLNELIVRVGELTLVGSGGYDPALESGGFEVYLEAPTPTTLLSGHTVSGTANATMSLDRQTGAVDAKLGAEDLAINTIRVGTLIGTAAGPLEELAYAVDLNNTEIGDQYISSFRSDGVVNVDGSTLASAFKTFAWPRYRC